MYTGCDVYTHQGDPNAVSAERAAVLAAVADGANKFHVSFIRMSFPTVGNDYSLNSLTVFGDILRYYGRIPNPRWKIERIS